MAALPASNMESGAEWEIISQYMKLHFMTLCTANTIYLRLCPEDYSIYQSFRDEFPDYDVQILSINHVNTENEKRKWAEFMTRFNTVEDYLVPTLLRLDTTLDYSPENTYLVPRIKFYAIESARNREGYNIDIRRKYA